MVKKLLMRRCLIFLLLILPIGLFAQNKNKITGTVVDATSKLPVSYVSVYVKGTHSGDMSNEKGEFDLYATPEQTIVASCLGYKESSSKISNFKNGKIIIYLEPEQYELAEITVKPKREKYKKKGNPAVEFVRNIIDRRDDEDPKKNDYYSYERYERFTYALNNFDESKFDKAMYKRFKFAKQYLDTSLTGKPVLNISLRETIEKNYYRKSPRSIKRVIEATKNDGMDEMLPQQGVKVLFSEVFKEIDIYQNDVDILTNHFVSPISKIAPSFYKFYLKDTVYIDGIRCRDLEFVPMNSQSFGFNGHLYVALDSTYFIKKARMNFGKEINVNFIDFLQIDQEFERDSLGNRFLTKDDMIVEFDVMPGIPEVYARRLNTYRQHSVVEPIKKEVFTYPAETTQLETATKLNEEYWDQHRHVPVAPKESSVADLMKGLRSIPLFYYMERTISILVAGYVPTKLPDGKFLYGPINTSASYNSLEGLRLRTGGLTSAFLNKRWFGYGYVAYGVKDEKLKYMGQVEYSFHDKKEHANEFPIHSLRASYTYDINELGQKYMTNKDNFVLSIKRTKDDRTIYNRKAEVSYQKEYHSGLSYSLQLRNLIEYSTQFVGFEQIAADGVSTYLKDYMMSEAELKIRYAPHEKYYQTKTKRVTITPETPILTLTHITSKKDFLGSDFTLNRTDLSFEKRFWLSAFGYIDTYTKVGKVWNQVPFTLLCLPNVNLSYTNQGQSFALMNPVEFINDEFLTWDYTYFLNGFVFNHIPLFNELGWREVLSFRGMWGSLSDKNNPQKTAGLFRFPDNTYLMGKTPYMECGVGIENVFKILRFDYIWRTTYLDHPNIDKGGFRVSMHVTF